MQDGESIRAEEARAWLKDHFAGDPAPKVSITWKVDTAEADPSAIYPLLDLLFGRP